MFLDHNEKKRLLENKEIFDAMYKSDCKSDIIKMVQYVLESTDHFEEQEIKNQFVIDFYKWCGIVNPELEN